MYIMQIFLTWHDCDVYHLITKAGHLSNHNLTNVWSILRACLDVFFFSQYV